MWPAHFVKVTELARLLPRGWRKQPAFDRAIDDLQHLDAAVARVLVHLHDPFGEAARRGAEKEAPFFHRHAHGRLNGQAVENGLQGLAAADDEPFFRAIGSRLVIGDAQRGTAEGLRRYLKLYAGVDVRIEEPGAAAALFTLDDNVALGFNTALAPAHEQGAVLASTATVGESHLLDAEQIGASLFEDVANRFCVQVYAAQLAEPRTIERVTAVIEREKPAHTDYHLCVIEPRMRVGFQARIGVDSIVAGPPPDLRLGDDLALGTDTVLPDRPHQSRRVGRGMRVGGTL